MEATTATRAYEAFDVIWDDGARWTNYDTADEAEAVLRHGRRGGVVERRTWQVAISADVAHLYRPGVGG